ncbi:VOC family protein [Bradyrhizobium sp. B117]|uniref:VOC family protein n=1 Tax=Bradyrhizobium sp. B117 TaxID=3140246 RepID=UPI00318382C1
MTERQTHPDDIRDLFSRAMSDMYRAEIPQYGTLLALVADVLGVERHGVIRLGTAQELYDIRRLFAVLGMDPVGYHGLSVAGAPVHSTAFRPITEDALRRNPFWVFTPLRRVDLIEDLALRAEAAAILAARRVFTRRVLELVGVFEAERALTLSEAQEFAREALETFRRHSDPTVYFATYRKLHSTLRLIADIVSFEGPHINHLTLRTLDIDALQAGMPGCGTAPKAIIEGPPRRNCPVLLRKNSFKAREERIVFRQSTQKVTAGTALFGEIKQRGGAMAAKGRKFYDELLASVRRNVQNDPAGLNASNYESSSRCAFVHCCTIGGVDCIPRGLASCYSATPAGRASTRPGAAAAVYELVREFFCNFSSSCTRTSYPSAQPASSSPISATTRRTTPRNPTGRSSKPYLVRCPRRSRVPCAGREGFGSKR